MASADDINKSISASNQKTPAGNELEVWRTIMKNKMIKLAIAAILVVIIFLSLNLFESGGSTAFGRALEQITKAKTITWSTTYYSHVTSEDEKRSWIETDTHRLSYKSPGLYREEKLDENMQIRSVTITDTVNLEEITLNPVKKEATIRKLALTNYDPEGPFVWVRKEINEADLKLVGERDGKDGRVNVFRMAFRDTANDKDWSYDFWIGKRSKDLAAVQVPGTDIFDPENDPAFGKQPEELWYKRTPVGHINHDIRFGMKLKDSLFELAVPEGYTVEDIARKQVTEKEMIDFLGVLVDYNDKIFPAQLFVTSIKLNEIEAKPENSRTEAEQKLLETTNYYKKANLNLMPIGHFLKEYAVDKSFRYIGKGVSLGDQNRIVCWYKLKDSDGYRAVYGDLSVKDVGAEELPLEVEP